MCFYDAMLREQVTLCDAGSRNLSLFIFGSVVRALSGCEPMGCEILNPKSI